MNTRNDGGPAFPGEQSPDFETVKLLRDTTGIGVYEAKAMLNKHGGMSLRDYFAAKALSGLSAHPEFGGNSATWLAEASYAQADAMIDERSK